MVAILSGKRRRTTRGDPRRRKSPAYKPPPMTPGPPDEPAGSLPFAPSQSRVLLDKSEGGIKEKSILALFLAPFRGPERVSRG